MYSGGKRDRRAAGLPGAGALPKEPDVGDTSALEILELDPPPSSDDEEREERGGGRLGTVKNIVGGGEERGGVRQRGGGSGIEG